MCVCVCVSYRVCECARAYASRSGEKEKLTHIMMTLFLLFRAPVRAHVFTAMGYACVCMYTQWYLNDDGIEYLREYLSLPPEIVPATLKKQVRAAPEVSGRDEGRGRSRVRILTSFNINCLMKHRARIRGHALPLTTNCWGKHDQPHEKKRGNIIIDICLFVCALCFTCTTNRMAASADVMATVVARARPRRRVISTPSIVDPALAVARACSDKRIFAVAMVV